MMAEFTGNAMGEARLEAVAIENTRMDQIGEDGFAFCGETGFPEKFFPDRVYCLGDWFGL